MPRRSFPSSSQCFWAYAAVLSFAASPSAHAQPSTTTTPVVTSVELGRVETSVVRVFAVQNVGLEEVPTDRGNRVVALPNMGHGTAFAVPGEGHLLLTAAHVIDNASYIVVRLPGNGAYYPARVAYRDPSRDVAVLSIEGDVPVLELQPSTHLLRTRQAVFTVGYPLDASRSQAQSSRGIVGGALDDGQVQLDMAANPGNSGGPIIDEQDRVVGMLVAGANVRNGVQGLALAVPLATLHAAIAEASSRVRDGRVGALPADAARAATVIDTLSRVGLMRVLREASDVTEGTTDIRSIEEVRALNTEGLSPDMQVFVAAFLWDAAQMLMDRAGRYVTPDTMPEGATRTLAATLLDEATTLLRAAAAADPTIADRSPFVRVASGSGATVVSSEALRTFAESFPAANGTPLPPLPRESWDWQSRRSWAITAGVGLGGAAHFGGDGYRDEYELVSPLSPGVGLRASLGLVLSPASAFSLAFDVDVLIVSEAELSEDSSPNVRGEFMADERSRSIGGGGTLAFRLHPGSFGFFVGPLLRVGVQSYQGSRRVGGTTGSSYDDVTKGFLVVQPGLDVGFETRAGVNTWIRCAFGVPEEGSRAGLYTVLLNLSYNLVRGSL